jgi:alpha-tubulin suppressor-like RCC1 family protein
MIKSLTRMAILMLGSLTAVLAGPLPSGWSSADIGTFTPAGTYSYTAETARFDVAGAGADIWGSADQFRYVYQPWTGDGEWIVQVASIQNTNVWAKAGIMVRENVTVGSRHAMLVLTPGSGVAFQRRKVADGASLNTSVAGVVAPRWLKLVRRGNQFDTFTSVDGTNWSYWTTDVVSMPADVLVGLAVTSHSSGVLASAVFSQFVATVPLAQDFPAGWSGSDIGAPALSGSGDYLPDSGVTTLRGAGADIWGTADQFQFGSQEWTGDVVLITRVDSLVNTNGWAKAGVMIRESLNPGSRHTMVVLTPGNGVAFQRRTVTDGGSLNTARAGVQIPGWLKLERWGDRFDGFYSTDGLTWKYLGSETIVMPPRVFIGLAVTSHNTGKLTEAVFSHFDYRTTGAPGGLWAEYFSGKTFNVPVLQRLDGMVDFKWGSGSPSPVVPVDNFSTRWTGSITPDVTQSYTFSTVSDDGVRLWVNGQLLIDNWTLHGATENTATVALTAGTSYSIKMEYYENTGSATARLLWAAIDRGKAPIAACYLTPSQYPDADADGIPDYWEKLHGLDPQNSADAASVDPQSNGLTYLQQYLISTNPNSPDTDGDGVPDIADPKPLDYYNGGVPLVSITTGNLQYGEVSQLNALPFEIVVSKPDGTGPLVNAPVTFVVAAGGGLLSSTAPLQSAATASLTLRTNSSGVVSAYYMQPSNGGIRSDITVSAGATVVTFTSFSRVVGQSLAAGGDQTLWADPAGVLRSWGRNTDGQLGDGTRISHYQPKLLNAFSLPVKSIAYGEGHGLAATTDGRVFSWGDNAFGQLGDGSITSRSSPLEIPALTNVVQIAAGDHHSLALESDGTVWAWGGNSSGQLGSDIVSRAVVPTQILALSGIVQIAAGAKHSAALAADGRAWVWGSNEFGQLAVVSTPQRTAPEVVSGLGVMTAIASGRQHLMALNAAGEVWAWGGNFSGQLGLGHTVTQAVPTRIMSSLPAIKAIAAGAGHSVALGANGQVWVWGSNTFGQLGDGTRVSRLLPASISLSSIRAIAAGRDHTVALKTDETLQAWGLNDSGQLGAITVETLSAAPVPVAAPVN